MSYVVEVERRIRVIQGLSAPVRARRELPLLAPGEGVELCDEAFGTRTRYSGPT
jgi:6-pyruvoyltetrahydropterin/6-carboxytetrahydropterin synthase